MSKVPKLNKLPILKSRRSRLTALAVIALILAYISASRAVDTGSWWEYGYSFVLTMFAINRLSAAFKGFTLHKKP